MGSYQAANGWWRQKLAEIQKAHPHARIAELVHPASPTPRDDGRGDRQQRTPRRSADRAVSRPPASDVPDHFGKWHRPRGVGGVGRHRPRGPDRRAGVTSGSPVKWVTALVAVSSGRRSVPLSALSRGTGLRPVWGCPSVSTRGPHINVSPVWRSVPQYRTSDAPNLNQGIARRVPAPASPLTWPP
jgi:hypothetical protein